LKKSDGFRARARIAASGLLFFVLLVAGAFAGELPKSTMPPLEVGEDVPEAVVRMIRIAQAEVVEADKKAMPRNNKYSVRQYNDQRKIGWCVCFVNWCADEAGLPLMKKKEAEPVPEEAVFASNEGSVPKSFLVYQQTERLTDVPQPGYLVIYGVIGGTPYTHVGMVETVTELKEGEYLLTTLEGNVANTVKRFCYRYTLNPVRKHRNFLPVRADDQTRDDAQYKLHSENWYITAFGQTWKPGAAPGAP
jgi:hypothetical protein